VGSTSFKHELDVVSSSGSLLPSLFPRKNAPFNEQEIADLEEAEALVLAGKKKVTEWWSLITNLVNTTHSRFSMGLIEAVHMTVVVSSTKTESPLTSERPSEATPLPHGDTPLARDSFPTLSQTLPALLPERSTRGALVMEAEEDSPKDDPGLLPMEWQTSALNGETSEFYLDSHTVEEPVFERIDTLIPSYTPWSNYNLSPQRTPANLVPGVLPPDPYVLSMAHLFNLPVPPGTHMNGGPGPGYPYYPSPPGMPRQESGNSHLANRGQALASEATDPPVLMSVGSVGHPYTCSKLGCKFAARRGCKEGAACSRCHLCVWTRAAERKTRPT